MDWGQGLRMTGDGTRVGGSSGGDKGWGFPRDGNQGWASLWMGTKFGVPWVDRQGFGYLGWESGSVDKGTLGLESGLVVSVY